MTPRGRKHLKNVLVGIPLLLMNGLLVLLACTFNPIMDGTSAEFWDYLCGVRLKSFSGHWEFSDYGGVYPVTDGWLVYYDGHHHGQFLYRLRPNQALRDWHEVQQELYAASTDPQAESCLRWLDKLGSVPDDQRIQRLVNEYIIEARPEGLALFEDRWRRANRIRLTLMFEAVWLTAWVVYLVWPPVRWTTPLASAARWGFAPLLLFLPFYLGYAPGAFTSMSPQGFIYPLVLVIASLPIIWLPPTPLDRILVSALPQVLWPISQGGGAPKALTSYGFPGPMAVILVGAAMALAAYAVAKGKRRTSSKRSIVP